MSYKWEKDEDLHERWLYLDRDTKGGPLIMLGSVGDQWWASYVCDNHGPLHGMRTPRRASPNDALKLLWAMSDGMDSDGQITCLDALTSLPEVLP